MSASLVGSEMCIRDRLVARMPPHTCASQVRRTNWPRREGTFGSPVSYTHLTLPTIYDMQCVDLGGR
eukprot:8244476-Alexandrium_andersonii.AAC.1